MAKEGKAIIRLSPDPEGFGETPDKLDAADFMSEVPVQHTHSEFEDDEIGLYVGLWDTETMVEAGGPYACDEFMWLLEGECQIRNNRTGAMETVKAGTPFVIPRGYDCQWHQTGYLRKFYVISEHPGEEIPAVPAHEGIVIPNQDASYKDSTGRFYAGIWTSGAFSSGLRPHPYNELAYIQEGSITLTDADGATEVFDAGDAIFIPEGTECDATVSDSVSLCVAVVKPG